MALTSSLPREDLEAEQQAAQAREQGTDLIREHLRGHLSNNPSSSYVTWIATLHPENATVVIDPRFYTPGNPWKTVYNEAKHDVYGDEEVAVEAVAVDPVQHQQTRSYAGFLDFIMGMMILITAVTITFGLEVCAVAMRCVARAFEWLYDVSYHHCWSKYTFGILWWLVWKSFWFSEMVFLYTSVFVTELLAGISWILCGILALDCAIARSAHQRTRRVSHLVRWACRRPCGSVDNGHGVPENVQEVKPQAVMPTATAVPSGGDAQEQSIQSATVVAIHDDVESKA